MQTKCLNCGKVLTSEEGHRLASVIADSSLPHKPMEKDVTWLRCEECHAVAVNRGEGPRQQHEPLGASGMPLPRVPGPSGAAGERPAPRRSIPGGPEAQPR
jgi:hypothetical protein